MKTATLAAGIVAAVVIASVLFVVQPWTDEGAGVGAPYEPHGGPYGDLVWAESESEVNPFLENLQAVLEDGLADCGHGDRIATLNGSFDEYPLNAVSWVAQVCEDSARQEAQQLAAESHERGTVSEDYEREFDESRDALDALYVSLQRKPRSVPDAELLAAGLKQAVLFEDRLTTSQQMHEEYVNEAESASVARLIFLNTVPIQSTSATIQAVIDEIPPVDSTCSGLWTESDWSAVEALFSETVEVAEKVAEPGDEDYVTRTLGYLVKILGHELSTYKERNLSYGGPALMTELTWRKTALEMEADGDPLIPEKGLDEIGFWRAESRFLLGDEILRGTHSGMEQGSYRFKEQIGYRAQAVDALQLKPFLDYCGA